MHARTRKIGAGILGVATITALVACSGGGGSLADGDSGSDAGTELESITVSVAQATNINGLAWRVGQSEGFFEDAGVIVEEIIPAEGGGTALQNVVSGDLPFGQVATGAIVNGFLEGAPIQVIAGATQSVLEIGWGVGIDSPIQTVEDLADVRWGFTSPGSVTEAMSYMVPAAAGLGDVDRASTGGVGAGIALLEAGDIGVTFLPPEVAAANADTLRVILTSEEYIPSYQTTMIVSSRDYAEKNPEITRAVLRGLSDAIDWIKDNPAGAGEILAESAELDPGEATELVQGYIDVDLWGLAFNPEALKAGAEGLKYTDGIDSVDWNSILTDEYLPEGQKGQIP